MPKQKGTLPFTLFFNFAFWGLNCSLTDIHKFLKIFTILHYFPKYLLQYGIISGYISLFLDPTYISKWNILGSLVWYIDYNLLLDLPSMNYQLQRYDIITHSSQKNYKIQYRTVLTELVQ